MNLIEERYKLARLRLELESLDKVIDLLTLHDTTMSRLYFQNSHDFDGLGGEYDHVQMDAGRLLTKAKKQRRQVLYLWAVQVWLMSESDLDTVRIDYDRDISSNAKLTALRERLTGESPVSDEG